MIDRIVDFSDAPARLRVRDDQLLVQRAEDSDVTLPLAELAVVVVSHPQVTYTQAVLARLAELGGSFVACNRQHLPVGMLLPLVLHHAQAERFSAQARAGLPLRKRIWQQIVRSKIHAQAAVLDDLYGTDHGVRILAPLVRSGDPANVEARAARRYWPQLFAERRFRRNPDNQDENLLLNYGYAVLRAIVARAICGAGLHPSLGLHHHNRYDAYCLADDLMEPFRPTVDRAVVRYTAENNLAGGLDPASKQAVIAELTGRYLVNGQQRTLFDTAARAASSLADVFQGQATSLELPDW